MAKVLQSTSVENAKKRQLPSGKRSSQVLNEERKHYDEQQTGFYENNELNIGLFESLRIQNDQIEKDKKQLVAENANLNQKLKEIEQLLDVLKSDAYQEGIKNAENMISEKLKSEQQALVDLIDSLETAQFDFLSSLEDILIETVFTAVTKVMSDIKINDSYLVSHIKTAMEQVSNKENVQVHLSPSDLARLKQCLNKESHIETGLTSKNIEFIADRSLDSGGCFISTKSLGGLDARLDSQLKELRSSLVKTFMQNNEVSL